MTCVYSCNRGKIDGKNVHYIYTIHSIILLNSFELVVCLVEIMSLVISRRRQCMVMCSVFIPTYLYFPRDIVHCFFCWSRAPLFTSINNFSNFIFIRNFKLQTAVMLPLSGGNGSG